MRCNDVCVTMEGDGYSEFSQSSMRRARKAYRCCECNDAIAIGDLHQYIAGKYDGDFWYDRTCAACTEIRSAFLCGWSYLVSELWESVRDQMFPKWNEMVAIDCLAKLTSDAAIAKMRAKYAEYVEAQS